eukprot:Rhum_TRINITY_DN11754_c0_g1::Rhum_TRINITY_DN11754_c0_g1_i1::g.46664::m.46664
MLSPSVSGDSLDASRPIVPAAAVAPLRPVVAADVYTQSGTWVEPAKPTGCWFFTAVFAAMMFLLHAYVLVSQPNTPGVREAGFRHHDTFDYAATWFFVYLGLFVGFLILMALAFVNLKKAPVSTCQRSLAVSLCWLLTFMSIGIVSWLIRIPSNPNGYKSLFSTYLWFAGAVCIAVVIGILALALALKQHAKNLVCDEGQMSIQVGVPLVV